jgi:hypothetical protein
MIRLRYMGALLGFFLAAGPVVATGAPFFDFYGYSFSDGDPFLVGSTTTVPVRFNTLQPEPALLLDFGQYEVTALIADLLVLSVEDHPPVRTLHYGGGEIRVFQDAGKDAQWTSGPPNGDVPRTFENGELVLTGYFTDCVMIFNASAGNGAVQGHVTFTGGTRLHELPHEAGWLFFGGTTNRPQGGLPAGYSLAWDPQLLAQVPVATRRSTWGAIKATYR